jgi:putative DNA primase/helicase
MTANPDRLACIREDQRQVNLAAIAAHAADVRESGKPLVDIPATTDWRSSLDRRGHRYSGDERNITLALRLAPELSGTLRFNEFADTVEVTRDLPWRVASEDAKWTDADDIALKVWLQQRDIDVRSTGSIAASVALIASERRWHPLRNRLFSTEWDGGTRLCGWLRDYAEASDDQHYLAAVGTAWMVGAIARIVEPGCQVDHALVLCGPQGGGKSQLARTLALDPAWFVGDLPDLRSADAAIALRGRWIVELAELAATRRAETEAVKSFITQRFDVYRPPYGRRAVTVPRTASFIGTTNEQFFLRDRTGNRRWWPVTVGKVDLPLLQRDVEQLWAEAIVLYQQGHPWHLSGDALALAETAQQDRLAISELEAAVAEYLDQSTVNSITVADVLRGALHLDRTAPDYADRAHRLGPQVAAAITAAGWEFHKRQGRDRRRVYVRKGRPV